MNQMNSIIMSGKKELILSDTVCFNPLDGIKIIVPISAGPTTIGLDNHLIFNLLFAYNDNANKGKYVTRTEGKTITISIENFGGSLLSGTTTPITFHIGKETLFFYFTGLLLTDNEQQDPKLLQFTFSIYKESSV